MTVQKEKYTKTQTQSHKKHACRQTKDKKTANYIYLKRIRKGEMLVGLKREKVGALCILWLKELSTFGA